MPAMTKAEYAAQYNGNRERIGTVAREPVIHNGGNSLLVDTEDWDPSTADMFFVEGAHSVHPKTGAGTGFDRGFVVSKVLGKVGGATELEVTPWMVIAGHLRNIASLPVAGATVYR